MNSADHQKDLSALSGLAAGLAILLTDWDVRSILIADLLKTDLPALSANGVISANHEKLIANCLDSYIAEVKIKLEVGDA